MFNVTILSAEAKVDCWVVVITMDIHEYPNILTFTFLYCGKEKTTNLCEFALEAPIDNGKDLEIHDQLDRAAPLDPRFPIWDMRDEIRKKIKYLEWKRELAQNGNAVQKAHVSLTA